MQKKCNKKNLPPGGPRGYPLGSQGGPGIPRGTLGSLGGALGSQGGPWTHGPLDPMGPWTHGPLDPWALGPLYYSWIFYPLGPRGPPGYPWGTPGPWVPRGPPGTPGGIRENSKKLIFSCFLRLSPIVVGFDLITPIKPTKKNRTNFQLKWLEIMLIHSFFIFFEDFFFFFF